MSASTTADCSPDCFSRYRLGLSARNRTFDRAKALASSSVDESNNKRFLALHLYRYAAPDCLEVDHIDAIEATATAVLACVQKHIEISERAFAGPQIRPRESLIDLCPVLTTRELDSCVGLLLGQTYDGIAADLDLSVTTVKTYRMRAFACGAIRATEPPDRLIA